MRQIAPFGLRMPPKLRDAVEKSARTHGRSLNAEIIHLLQFALDVSSRQGFASLNEKDIKNMRFILRSLDGKIELELVAKG